MRESIRMKKDNISFKFRVAGIIIKDNKILLDKTENSPNYYLPGGYVELGETTKQALMRELKEELLLDFKIEKYLGVLENFFNHQRRGITHEISFYYLVNIPKKLNLENFLLTEDDKGHIINHSFEWIDLNDLKKYDFRPENIIDYLINKKEFNHLVLDKTENL